MGKFARACEARLPELGSLDLGGVDGKLLRAQSLSWIAHALAFSELDGDMFDALAADAIASAGLHVRELRKRQTVPSYRIRPLDDGTVADSLWRAVSWLSVTGAEGGSDALRLRWVEAYLRLAYRKAAR